MRCAASHVLMSETRSIVGELMDYFGFAIKDETFGVQMDQVSRGYFGDAIPELRIPRNSPTQSTLNSPGRSAGFRPPSEAASAADAKRQRVPLIITSFFACSG